MKIDSSKLENIKNCPVCGYDRCILLHHDLVDIRYNFDGEWKLQKCNKCGCAFLNPRMKKRYINEAYKDYYTHKRESINNKDLGRIVLKIKKVLKSINNSYIQHRYGGEIKPSCTIGNIITRLLYLRRKKIDRAYRHIPKVKANSTLLDIGCGSGEYLQLPKTIGWEVLGVDFDKSAIKIANTNNIKCVLGDVENVEKMGVKFDVITLSHVIEHVHNPEKLLLNIKKLLKPDGLIWIETPNLKSVGHKVFKKSWAGLEPPRHLVLFNWSSLESLLKKCGFNSFVRYPRNDLFLYKWMINNSVVKTSNKPMSVRALLIPISLITVLVSLYILINYKKSEFITIQARS